MLNSKPDVKIRQGTILLLAILGGLILFYGFTQPLIETGDGHPYDADVYFLMAQQVAQDEPIAQLRPFVTRIGLPWLAGSLFPDDVMLGFIVLNLLFALGALGLLALYLQRFMSDSRLLLVVLILFVVSPASPFRFTWYIPAYTDPPALFFMTGILLLGRIWSQLTMRNSITLGLLGCVGVLFREIVLCAVLVVAFTHCARLVRAPPFIRIHAADSVLPALLSVLLTVAGILLTGLLVTATGDYSYLAQVRGVVTQLVQQLSIYPLAWLTAFGCIPLVVMLSVNRRLLAFLGANQDVLLFLAGMAVLAAIAGFHTDRLVFWSYPALLVVFGKALEIGPIAHSDRVRKVLFFGPLILMHALALRAVVPIPPDTDATLFDPGSAPELLLSVYGEGARLGHLYASSMQGDDRLVLLTQFCLAALYLALVLHFRRHREYN